MKDWDKPGAASTLDYRATGPLLYVRHGKNIVENIHQSTQYLVTKDTVIAFTQKDAQRSLPLGFNSRNDLLITYISTANFQ